jgi:hypothetical protein
MPYLFIGTCNFHYCETYEPQKTVFFIIRTESIRKYICRLYHQLSQYITKLRQITIDLCKPGGTVGYPAQPVLIRLSIRHSVCL